MNRLFLIVNNLTEMATFAEVVEQGSFTAAAERLGVSKAFVSKHVSTLEARFGVVLLRRTTRRLVVTEEGARFADYCQRMVETAREGVQTLATRSHKVSGSLRVSAPITFGQTFLTGLVQDFTAAYPFVEVDLVLDNRFVDLAGENLDLAFRITDNPPQTLALTPLGVMEDVLCAAPAYLERCGTPQTPEELSAHECLLYLNPGRIVRWTLRRERRVQVVEVRGRTACNYHSALLGPLLAGKGVAKLPHYFVSDHLREGSLVRVLPDYQAEQIPIYLVHHQPAGQPPRVREFIQFTLRELFQRIPLP